jgi:hypothetical protein
MPYVKFSRPSQPGLAVGCRNRSTKRTKVKQLSSELGAMMWFANVAHLMKQSFENLRFGSRDEDGTRRTIVVT